MTMLTDKTALSVSIERKTYTSNGKDIEGLKDIHFTAKERELLFLRSFEAYANRWRK